MARTKEIPASLQRSLEAAVSRGVKLLDRKRAGWARKVKVTKLDMSDGCNCIVGQNFDGDYDGGFHQLGITGNTDYRYGFDVPEELAAFKRLEEDDWTSTARLKVWGELDR